MHVSLVIIKTMKTLVAEDLFLLMHLITQVNHAQNKGFPRQDEVSKYPTTMKCINWDLDGERCWDSVRETVICSGPGCEA